MPTNENTYNSRVTSEALEAKFRQVFPSQGGAELVDDLYASGVIQPVIDFSSVAEGSVLGQNLQTAWDFSTGTQQTANTTDTVINNTGFWKVETSVYLEYAGVSRNASLNITDGLSTKVIWRLTSAGGVNDAENAIVDQFVVFLRAGDSLTQTSNAPQVVINTQYRQIATVNGTLVNPLGFSFS